MTKRTTIYNDVIFYGNGKFEYVNVDEAKELIAELQENVATIEAAQQSVQRIGGTCAICGDPLEAHHVEDGGHPYTVNR